LQEFTEEAVKGEEILALTKKVKVESDEALSAVFPGIQAAIVTIKTKDGEYTVVRIDREEGGRYVILPLTCKTTPGPKTHGTYIWGEFEDLQAVEDKLIDGPYIHHFVEMEGDFTRELAEFCKYFPNLNVDKI
jgi:hypothetical protein